MPFPLKKKKKKKKEEEICHFHSANGYHDDTLWRKHTPTDLFEKWFL
jgi:hypothetical protein